MREQRERLRVGRMPTSQSIREFRDMGRMSNCPIPTQSYAGKASATPFQIPMDTAAPRTPEPFNTAESPYPRMTFQEDRKR